MFRLRALILSFLLVLVACAALIWFIFDRDMRGLEARVQGRSQLLRSSFGVIEYASTGEGHPVLVIHGSGGGFDQALEFRWRSTGGKIACPVLAISAEDDLYGTAASARHVVATVPDGRLHLFPQGGHLLVGHDDAVWQAVASFIAEAFP